MCVESEAEAFASPWPGTDKRCPKCLGLRVGRFAFAETKFYSSEVAICADCGIAWEPLDEDQIWDRSDALCSFKDPCSNCAFRPGSSEQRNKEKWRETILSLKEGARFYCHKGVPIAPMSGNGFDYPTKPVTVTIEGVTVETTVQDIAELRLCRGYLNALRTWTRKEHA